MGLRKQLLHLAITQPKLRQDLLPLLRQTRIALVIPPRRLDAFNNVLVARLQKHQQKAEDIGAVVAHLSPEAKDGILDDLYEQSSNIRYLPSGKALALGLKKFSQDANELVRNWSAIHLGLKTGDYRYVEKQYHDLLRGTVLALNGEETQWVIDIPEHFIAFSKALNRIKMRQDVDLPYLKKDYKATDFDAGLALMDYHTLRTGLVETLQEALTRVETLFDKAYTDTYPRENPKLIQKIETLYHASIHAAQIYRSGFAQSVPDVGGLGGLQEAHGGVKGTSFTYDLRIALAIARGFKEVISIANGELKLQDIKKWATHHGILDTVYLTFREYQTQSREEPTNDVYGTFRFYQAYSQVRDVHHLQYDPHFYGNRRKIVDSFKGKSLQNVGVLVAQVDMSHPNIKYVGSREREFRVPPEAIIQIVKLIK